VPLDDVEAFHKVNCLDAHAIEERNRIAPINVKESCDHTADVGTNFNDTFHPGDHSKTFDGSLQKFSMCLDKIEFTLIFCLLLCLTMCFELGKIILANKTQNGNQTHLKFQRVQRGALKVGCQKCRAKFFEMCCINLWVVRGLNCSARLVGTWLKHMVKILTVCMEQTVDGWVKIFFMAWV
jgi:hypothetical protein